MIIEQVEFKLNPYPRGMHLISSLVDEHLQRLTRLKVGLAHLFIKHSSAALTLNENADPDVRVDLNAFMDRLVPENAPYFLHTIEGPDDMPAHIKTSLIGPSLSIPISKGHLNLGTWQGIYLCEFRNHGGPRNLVLTISGQTN